MERHHWSEAMPDQRCLSRLSGSMSKTAGSTPCGWQVHTKYRLCCWVRKCLHHLHNAINSFLNDLWYSKNRWSLKKKNDSLCRGFRCMWNKITMCSSKQTSSIWLHLFSMGKATQILSKNRIVKVERCARVFTVENDVGWLACFLQNDHSAEQGPAGIQRWAEEPAADPEGWERWTENSVYLLLCSWAVSELKTVFTFCFVPG